MRLLLFQREGEEVPHFFPGILAQLGVDAARVDILRAPLLVGVLHVFRQAEGLKRGRRRRTPVSTCCNAAPACSSCIRRSCRCRPADADLPQRRAAALCREGIGFDVSRGLAVLDGQKLHDALGTALGVELSPHWDGAAYRVAVLADLARWRGARRALTARLGYRRTTAWSWSNAWPSSAGSLVPGLRRRVTRQTGRS